MKPAAAYDPASLPDDAYGKMVKYGKELTERTYAHIGPEVKDVKMRYAGNNLSCTSCHQASATKPFAMSWVGSHSTFPQYRGREDTISTIEERVNGCMERSMNGKSLPFDSKEMKAFTTYIHFLSKDVPVGTKAYNGYVVTGARGATTSASARVGATTVTIRLRHRCDSQWSPTRFASTEAAATHRGMPSETRTSTRSSSGTT